MSIRSSIKYGIACVLLLVSSMLGAAPRSKSGAQHYITVSISGAEANNVSFNTPVKPQLGAGCNLGLGYEVHIRQFLLGVGVQAGYQLLNDGMAEYTDNYSRVDREGEPVEYGYHHENYKQQDQMLQVAFPIYIGGQFGDYVYATLGASFAMPLWNQYQVQTDMLTQGTYAWSIEPVRTQGINDFTSYGYYAQSEYNYKDRYLDQMAVHVNAEIGSNIPLPASTQHRLRIGVYCSYGLRLGTSPKNHLVNLSQVNLDPQTQTEANMKQHIRWEPLNTSDIYKSLPHNLEVGVRFTALINVKADLNKCHCLGY